MNEVVSKTSSFSREELEFWEDDPDSEDSGPIPGPPAIAVQSLGDCRESCLSNSESKRKLDANEVDCLPGALLDKAPSTERPDVRPSSVGKLNQLLAGGSASHDVDCEARSRLDESLSRMQKDNAAGEANFNRYMRLKKDKLNYQVNITGRPRDVSSAIFKGISIFVNGFTDPPALELRNLIQLHGGEYHCYYEHGVTTYIIASSLANVKASKTRRNETFVKPEWIVDCITAGRVLNVENYILLATQKKGTAITFFNKDAYSEESTSNVPILDARDPNFLEEYYARSRLHLISTLAQEMKDYVYVLRENKSHSFEGLKVLQHLADPNYTRLTSRIIFHVDLDCFFVSVALRDRPDLVGKPVAITHSKGVSAGFSELASVSYAARKCGLQNGMIVRDALKLCPNLVCLPYLFDDYRQISKTIYSIVTRYTLEIRAVSCDEMYIDCTKVLEQSRIGNPVAFAEHLRAEIKQETGCPASVGIGGSVLIARLATRYAKPDGVRWVSPSEAKAFIANEKIRNLPGLGYHTFEKLVKAYGEIERCSELQAIPQSDLERLLGKKIGEQLSRMCRGLDDGKNIVVSNARKSISCDINYGIRFTKKSEVAHFLHVIAQELERKLKQARMVTSSVTLKLMIRSADAPVETAKYLGHGKCDTQNKSASLDHPTGCAQVIAMVILKLFSKLAPVVADIRGIGVQCGRLGLISDVGYSVNSEAITRMFGSRVQKKEMAPEEVERERPQTSRKELPFASSNSPPSFFGESDEARILRDLKKYLHSVPNEDAVGVITDFLFTLLRDGCLDSLVSMCLALHTELYSPERVHSVDPAWLFALCFVFVSLDNRCRVMYGASTIQPAIQRLLDD